MREINILDVKYHTVHLSLRRNKKTEHVGYENIHRRLLYLFFHDY